MKNFRELQSDTSSGEFADTVINRGFGPDFHLCLLFPQFSIIFNINKVCWGSYG